MAPRAHIKLEGVLTALFSGTNLDCFEWCGWSLVEKRIIGYNTYYMDRSIFLHGIDSNTNVHSCPSLRYVLKSCISLHHGRNSSSQSARAKQSTCRSESRVEPFENIVGHARRASAASDWRLAAGRCGVLRWNRL